MNTLPIVEFFLNGYPLTEPVALDYNDLGRPVRGVIVVAAQKRGLGSPDHIARTATIRITKTVDGHAIEREVPLGETVTRGTTIKVYTTTW